MRFVPINKENLEFYQEFQNAQDLSLYMSRIYPDRDSVYLKWMYIEEDQEQFQNLCSINFLLYLWCMAD